MKLCDAGEGGALPGPAASQTNQRCLFSRAPVELWMLWFTSHLPPLMNDSIQPRYTGSKRQITRLLHSWMNDGILSRDQFFSLVTDTFFRHVSTFLFRQLIKVYATIRCNFRNADKPPVYFLPSISSSSVRSQETKKAETLGFISPTEPVLKTKFSEKYVNFMTW